MGGDMRDRAHTIKVPKDGTISSHDQLPEELVIQTDYVYKAKVLILSNFVPVSDFYDSFPRSCRKYEI
ncbi:hypothetical protein CDL15_Pgr028799 [Punica granatum]|uniref:Uncharacterized protein n=1 Tax=Punica granatum TaxID=22663 RepID=A0A218VYJ0_PUNGR|nr:hypothetical protein CDL15_Pgr028799 [Punica granatum]